MKKLLFLALLALCVVGATAQKASDAYKASKNVAQNIATSSTPTLSTNCRHTQLNINNWDKNAIETTANIKVTCSNPKKVQAILDCIEVTISKQGDGVSVTTNIDSKSIESIKNRNENYSYNISIEINAPLGTKMAVDNKYGHTYIQGTTSSLNAIIKYGNLTVGTIGKPSTVTIKYGNIKIDRASDIELAIKYGNATVEQMDNLKIIESGYGKHKYGNVNNVTGSARYDKYSFGVINGRLNFSSCRYTNVDIDIAKGAINIEELDYGSLNVYRTLTSFGGINVSASYSKIGVNIDNGAAYNLSLSTSYGKLYPEIPGVTYQNNNTNSQSFAVTVGSNPTKWVKIANRYGNIRITQG